MQSNAIFYFLFFFIFAGRFWALWCITGPQHLPIWWHHIPKRRGGTMVPKPPPTKIAREQNERRSDTFSINITTSVIKVLLSWAFKWIACFSTITAKKKKPTTPETMIFFFHDLCSCGWKQKEEAKVTAMHRGSCYMKTCGEVFWRGYTSKHRGQGGQCCCGTGSNHSCPQQLSAVKKVHNTT